MGFLEDTRIFVKAVEKGGFSAAGRELRMSPAVVSGRIIALEKQLKCRLFNRTTRKIHLTSAGQQFHERCLEILASVERAAAAAQEESATAAGVLKVTAPLGLGRRLLAPVVADFVKAHPNVSVRLRLSDYLLDLIDEGVDIALRMANFADSSFVLRKVARIDRVLCASPAYLANTPALATPHDLFNHRCLLLRFPGSQQYRWTLSSGGAEITLPVAGDIDADDGDILTGWALAGLGVVLKPTFEVAEHLQSGRLVSVLHDFPPEPVTLGVLYPTRSLAPPRIKLFTDLLVERGRAHVRAELDRIGARLE
ncbi:LysR family transcriptional regulator [Terrarubrum flagellatum]|uniref:LysR family transcriptional regulator n=1 Tax=Terrirubrum flagellatum TaxID=2895980 RepID=UPI0031455CE0